ncbi:hypothetical protein [Celeribacter sp.]|uniref:hypothetical protein n=1 Tax=Celeribacter sp. TaxID=1890673 RepID=UPI003A904CD5
MSPRFYLSIAMIAGIVLMALMAGYAVGIKPYAGVVTYLVTVVGAGVVAWFISARSAEGDDENF